MRTSSRDKNVKQPARIYRLTASFSGALVLQYFSFLHFVHSPMPFRVLNLTNNLNFLIIVSSTLYHLHRVIPRSAAALECGLVRVIKMLNNPRGFNR